MGIIKIPDSAKKEFAEHYPKILESGNLAEGEWNGALASLVKNMTSANGSVCFNSNGSGLLAILLLLKRYRGYQNIFIQANTMYGVKTIAVTSGLKYLEPVECRLRSLMPDIGQLKNYIKKLDHPQKTVFLLTHIGGIVNPDILEIAEVCKQSGIALVEDCAHSFGATLHSRHTGLFGVAGVYSFYSTKAIPAGEGGVAVTHDKELAEQLQRFNIYDRFEQKQDVGINFRQSEIQALFAFCVCKRSDEIIKNKDRIAEKYIEACQKLKIDFISPYQNGQKGNNYKFTVLLPENNKIDLRKIKNKTSAVYDYALGNDPENISRRHLCLPIWYALEEEKIQATLSELECLRV